MDARTMTSRWTTGGPQALAVFAALFALAMAVYLPAFDILPFTGDNFYVLSWASGAGGRDLVLVDPAIYPEWRPLAYASVWAQYQGLESMGPYYLVNVLLLTACGWIVFMTVSRESGGLFGSIAAAALVLTDQRATTAVTWIVERQSSMACLLGLTALIVDDRQARRAGDWRTHAPAVTLLLVASMLSKEYGLACAVTILLRAAWERRVPAAVAAGGSLLAYLFVRAVIAHGAAHSYCTEGGFFFDRRVVCFDGTPSPGAVAQMGYNVGASLVGIALPGLFTGDGVIGVSRVRFATGLLTLACAGVGWWRGSTLVRSMLLVVLVSAGSSFLLYRDRNQFIAMYAMAVPVGVGLSQWLEGVRRGGPRPRWLLPLGACALTLLVAVQANRTRTMVVAETAELLADPPCTELSQNARAASFLASLARRYVVTPVECGGPKS